MKRRIMLSIAIVLSIALVSLISSDSSVEAQNQIRIVGDTGLVRLGPGQILRVTVVGALDLNDLFFRVNRQSYTQTACNGGVCKLAVESQTTSNLIPLAAGEGAFFDIFITDADLVAVRGVVLSNSKDVHVNAVIVDALTGKVVSVVSRTDNASPLL